MVTAEEIAQLEGQGLTQALARQMMRNEITAAYWRGRSEAASGLAALFIGIMIGATAVGLVCWAGIA